MIEFNKYNVSDGKNKARVHYSLDNRIDGRRCVTIYAKDYDHALAQMFAAAYKNDTDSQQDYFEKGRVVLFEDHPLYAQARQSILARLCPTCQPFNRNGYVWNANQWVPCFQCNPTN